MKFKGKLAVIARSESNIRQALDPNRFIGIELPPDILFDRQYQAQMCKTRPYRPQAVRA